MVKILHTADIHLDSPFSLEDPSVSKARKDELREAFSSMMDYVRKNGIQLLMIAGDLFEYEYATKETVDLVISEFEKSSDCEIVIAPGNHDPYSDTGVYKKTIFPENVHIFSDEKPEIFSFPDMNVDVYGYAFTSRHMEQCPAVGLHPTDKKRINILCAHADTTSPISKYAPLTAGDIYDSGFDYVALGHIHNGGSIQREGYTYYAYCGCLEGRDYGESGYKGALVGTIDKDLAGLDVSLSRVRFSRRRYAAERINASGFCDASDVVQAINGVIRRCGYGSDTLLRVILEGNVSPELCVSQKMLKELIDPVFSFELRDDTVPLYGYDKLSQDPTIRGSLFNRILPDLTQGSVEEREIAAMALRYALAVIDGKDIVE